jgi:SAM-dependent methyltransferase
VAAFVADGYDMFGVDAVCEGLRLATDLQPRLMGRLVCHDVRQGIPFDDDEFDFVMCNSVIQHLAPSEVYGMLFPELVRVLKPGGVCLLHFKWGSGTWTVMDPDYAGAIRSFLLYEPEEVVRFFRDRGLTVIPKEEGKLGGIIKAQDTKASPECVLWLRS